MAGVWNGDEGSLGNLLGSLFRDEEERRVGVLSTQHEGRTVYTVKLGVDID